MSITQWNMKTRVIFFVMFTTLLTLPISIDIWRDGPKSISAQQDTVGGMNKDQVILWNETLSLDQAQIAMSDEAQKATNQTIITLPNNSISLDASASLAGAAAESGLQVEALPLTGSIIINGTEEDVSDAQGLAGRGSGLLPTEKSRLFFMHSQSLPTGVDRIDAERSVTSHNATTEGPMTNATIGILDTGIDPNHPDLNVDVNLSRSFADLSPNFTDVVGHGTHVAGIAAAKDNGEGVVGVAPGAKVVAIKVLNDEGWGTTADILQGLEYVLANAEKFDVINLSLGGAGRSDAIDKAIRQIVDARVPVVVSAGNDYDDSTFYGPANSDAAITVSSSYDGDGKCGGLGPSTERRGVIVPDDTFATYSNWGGPVDVIAPGTLINSTVPGGGYERFSGTSMAAPHVTGAIALLKSIFPGGLEGDSPADLVRGIALAGQGERIVICELLSEDGRGTLSNWTTDGDSSHEPHLYTGVAEVE